MTAKEVRAWMEENSPHTPTAGLDRQPEDRAPRALSVRGASRELALPVRLVERTMRPKRG